MPGSSRPPAGTPRRACAPLRPRRQSRGRLARARRLDRSVEREQVGLAGDAGDGGDDRADLLGLGRQLADCSARPGPRIRGRRVTPRCLSGRDALFGGLADLVCGRGRAPGALGPGRRPASRPLHDTRAAARPRPGGELRWTFRSASRPPRCWRGPNRPCLAPSPRSGGDGDGAALDRAHEICDLADPQLERADRAGPVPPAATALAHREVAGLEAIGKRLHAAVVVLPDAISAASARVSAASETAM